MYRRGWLAVGLAIALGGSVAQAVILFGTSDPAANTTPPTGALADSGWANETDAGTCATAISPWNLLTAAHITVSPGDAVHFGGLVYRVTRTAVAPASDLRFLEVAGRLDAARVAPHYTQTNEVGLTAVLHGRGGQRGAPVFFDAPTNAELRGWSWTPSDGRLRWGTNLIADTLTQTNSQPGQFLVAVFSADAGADEGTLSTGDSGGGVFLQDSDGRWKLAGVLYAVESEFRSTADGGSFSAALFDRRGYFEKDDNDVWVQVPEADPQPGTVWLATRVSAYREWIADETAQSPSGEWPLLLSAPTLEGPFAEHGAYAVDVTLRRITVQMDGEQRYFRLEGAAEILTAKPAGGQLELQY